MQDIPSWIVRVIEVERMICNRCKGIFTIKNLISLGIQESSQHPHSDTLVIGMYCPKCRELTIFELKEMTLLDFAFEILEDKETTRQFRNKKIQPMPDSPVKKRCKKRGKITLKEAQKDIKFLKQVKTHEEFLLATGMSPEEINKYNYKKTKRKHEQ